jgi:hypothetical protein
VCVCVSVCVSVCGQSIAGSTSNNNNSNNIGREGWGQVKRSDEWGVGKEIRWIRRVDDDLYLCIKQDNDHDEDGTMTCT